MRRESGGEQKGKSATVKSKKVEEGKSGKVENMGRKARGGGKLRWKQCGKVEKNERMRRKSGRE